MNKWIHIYMKQVIEKKMKAKNTHCKMKEILNIYSFFW